MVNSPARDRIPCDSRLLRESWAANGFNEADLCLLEEDALQQGLRSWMESVNWLSLLPDIEALPACQAFMKKELWEESDDDDENDEDESGFSFSMPTMTLVDDIRKPASAQ